MQIPIEQLTKRPITFTFTDEDFARVDFKAREIHKNVATSHGRSFNKVYESTLLGEMAEIALIRLGARPNPYNRVGFDHTDRKTWAWDVEFDGHRIEVKCQAHYNLDKWYRLYDKQYNKFHRLMKHSIRPTRLIVGYNMKDHLPTRNDRNVRISWMINQDFSQFMDDHARGRHIRSQFEKGPCKEKYWVVRRNVQMPKGGV